MSILVYGAMLALLSSPLVVLSNSVLNRVDVIRHTGSPPSADAFSNPGCQSRYCADQGTHCYNADCCKCQCPNNKANYIVNKWSCLSRDELNQMNSTRCKYSIRKPDQPLLGLPLTDVMVQEVHFTDTPEHQTLIPCIGNIQISWEYRDAFGEWKEGENNIFTVGFYIKNGVIRDQRVITSLKWTGKLSSKYAGLLIRFLFKCGGIVQGCALAKISGQHTYDTTKLPTVRPQPVISTTKNTTKIPPTTAEIGPSTTESLPTTTESPLTTLENQPTTPENPPTTKTSETTQIFDKNTNAYQKGKDQGANKGDSAAIFGPVVGILGLICLIGIMCVVAAKYRRRKRNSKDPETNSAAALEEYQDPIYDVINKGDFDNPVYCDPTKDPDNIKAQLGPLPDIPGSESTYQPLDSLTRTSPDYDNPVNGERPEVDYDNPIVGMQTTNDYDNPPVKDGMKNTGDYDNPPVKDSKENTEDYDNPPVKGPAEINQDYDNPPPKNEYDTPRTNNAQSDTAEDTFF